MEWHNKWPPKLSLSKTVDSLKKVVLNNYNSHAMAKPKGLTIILNGAAKLL
jgi:hypothetical protein